MAFRYNELGSEVAGGPFTKGRFAFPIEDRDRYASKIQFQVVKIIPPRLDLKLNTQTGKIMSSKSTPYKGVRTHKKSSK